jgi:hypothetical protein
MKKKFLVFLCALFVMVLYSCSRRSHPAKTSPEVVTTTIDSAAVTKPVIKKKEKVVIPKVIVVNDSAAHKSVDGRYYYDMLGHRYWKNNKDGKYYLFNKSMYNNPDFNKPG